MGEDVVGQAGIDADVAAAVCPVYRWRPNADGLKARCSHQHTAVAGQAPWADADLIEVFLKEPFHQGGIFVGMAGVDWSYRWPAWINGRLYLPRWTHRLPSTIQRLLLYPLLFFSSHH